VIRREAEENGVGAPVVPIWNTETLRAYVLAKIEGLASVVTTRIDALEHVTIERWQAAEKQNHIAFEAHERAVDLASEAQEKALTERTIAQKAAIDAAFQAQKEAVASAMAAADRAIQKAETAAEKRFESVNEFRSTLGDQQRMLMPRSESEALHRAFDEKLSQVNKDLTEKIDALTKTAASVEDRKVGNRDGWQWAILSIGALLTLLTIANVAVNFFRVVK
jgi:hypothetical protein